MRSRNRGPLALLVALTGCGVVPGEYRSVDASDGVYDVDAGAEIDAPPLPAPSIVQFDRDQVETVEHGTVVAGDLTFRDVCPAGEALVGLDGATATISGGHPVVGVLQGRCGGGRVAAASDGWQLGTRSGYTMAAHGKSNDLGAWSRGCAVDQFVVGFRARAGSRLDAVQLRCAPIKLTPGAREWQAVTGEIADLPIAGGDGGLEYPAVDCPAGELVTGLFGAGQAELGALGLICARPTVK